jgi:hypothetical protein
MTEGTGGELLTLWKVGRVELPKIAQVYLDATPSQPTIINAEPGQISAHLHPK